MQPREPIRSSTHQSTFPLVVVVAFFVVWSIVLMAPQTCSAQLPDNDDLKNAVGLTVQARMAFEQSGLPIRITPWEFRGTGYPTLQFYGQVPYTLAAVIHRYVTPDNPYQPLMILSYFSFFLGGLFSCLSSYILTRSPIASVLSGAMYAAAPYFLVNVHYRFAYCEAVAQGIIPIVFYFNLRYFYSPKPAYWILSILAWALLAGTHIITFLYFTLFFFVSAVFVTLFEPVRWRRMLAMTGSMLFGAVLIGYHLFPVVLERQLRIRGELSNPYWSHTYTRLPTLLAPCAVPPHAEPIKGYFVPGLFPSIGWPALLAAATVLWIFYQNWRTGYSEIKGRCARTRAWLAAACIVFIAAFLLTWSPFDLWQFLPTTLFVVQFTYRILTYCMWSGAMLFGFALTLLWGTELRRTHLILGILIIGFASSSYLHSLKIGPYTINDIKSIPWLDNEDFLYRPTQTIVNPKSLLSTSQIDVQFIRQGSFSRGTVDIDSDYDYVQIPVLYYPTMLQVTVDGNAVPTICVLSNELPLTGIHVPQGRHAIEARFVGYRWANDVSMGAFAVLLAIVLLEIGRFGLRRSRAN